ncbi:MAG: monovalent cation:proton antiporter-2 (CPA2) family protein [Bdellovibrionales bacterium]
MDAHGFLIYAIIFLTASVIAVPVSKKLGLGSVLGYLLAGIIVGPSVMSLVHGSEDMAHYAELGVVFLLFIIGLELQPKKLWNLRHQLLGFGAGQVVISTAALFFIIYFLAEMNWQAALVGGFALALYSTSFVLQSMIEKGELKTQYGQATFSVLLAQDLLAIPALAMIPLLAVQSDSDQSWNFTQGLLILGFIFFLVISSRTWLGPAFRWMASTKSREIFTAATLLLVFAVSFIMQKLGLSMGLGAFMAGVLLADSEYRHEIEVDLEPFKALLMGFFFISVGVSVPLQQFLDHPLQSLLWVAIFMAVKFVILFTIGSYFKLSRNSAKQMALYLALGGEFAFVITLMAQKLKIFTDLQAQSFNLVVTLSMLLTPVLIFVENWLSLRRQKMSQKIEYDKIDTQEPQVIIAGLGRFGQIFGRIFRAQGIVFTAIDHDPDQIELLRKFGNKVYYGDCSREEILEAAGAKSAKLLILAVDDSQVSVKTAELIKEKFPQLKIFARARNRQHAFELMDLGITNIKREVFDSSLNFAGVALVELGMTKQESQIIIEKFKAHDESLIQEQYKHKDNEKNMINLSQLAIQQLEQVLKSDSKKEL